MTDEPRMAELAKTLSFSALMLKRLDDHADKGRLSWEDYGIISLMMLLVSELGELTDAVIDIDYEDGETVQAVIDECGDVANFAMMIADNLGGLEVTDDERTTDD